MLVSPKEIVLVKCTILRLSPVMSSMLSVFQTPEASGVHAMWQVEPSLKISPGPGSEGVGSAKATNTADKIKVGRTRRDNMANGDDIKKIEKVRRMKMPSRRRVEFKRAT